jgi:hypothetical protein
VTAVEKVKRFGSKNTLSPAEGCSRGWEKVEKTGCGGYNPYRATCKYMRHDTYLFKHVGAAKRNNKLIKIYVFVGYS